MRALETAATSRSGSSSTSVFAPVSTVSTHSVDGRSVMQGTPCQYASFWRPPESVVFPLHPRTRAALALEGLEVAGCPCARVEREDHRRFELVDALDDACQPRPPRVGLAVECEQEVTRGLEAEC